MNDLTYLGYQILELIARRNESGLSSTREKLNEVIRIPDRDFHMSISFYEQAGWIEIVQDCVFITLLGKAMIAEYVKSKEVKPLPALQL